MQEPKIMNEVREAGVAGDLHIARFYLFWGAVMAALGALMAAPLVWVPGLLGVGIGLWGVRGVLKAISATPKS